MKPLLRLRLLDFRTSIALCFGVILSQHAYAEKTTREIYEQNKGAIVLIIAYDAQGIPASQGSGFYFETNRVASNYHVVDGASRLEFRTVGSERMHKVKSIVAASRTLDLAILEVEQPQTPLVIKSIKQTGVGDKVVAIGSPRGLEGSVSEGIVSALRGDGDIKLLQITTPISPGSSGGPLFSTSGDVIGVTTATLRDSQNLNFAVPASLLLTLRERGHSWEPVVRKGLPTPVKGNTGVQLVSAVSDGKPYGEWSYSLLNNNNRPIRNVKYLLIFWDRRTIQFVHFIPCLTEDMLPPGLAKRFSLSDHALKGLMDREYYPYKVGDGYLTALVGVGIRVLDYEFVTRAH